MQEDKSDTTVVLFPGYKCNHTTWSKIVEKGHPRRGSSIDFLDKLQKSFNVHFADVSWVADLDIENFIDELHKTLAGRKLVLVGHSLGALFCYLYAKKFRDQVSGIILIDGCYLGSSSIGKCNSTDEVLNYFASCIPAKDFTMPAKAVCFRNLKLVANDRLEYTDETKLKNYTVKHYVQLGHYLHCVIPDEIIAAIHLVAGAASPNTA